MSRVDTHTWWAQYKYTGAPNTYGTNWQDKNIIRKAVCCSFQVFIAKIYVTNNCFVQTLYLYNRNKWAFHASLHLFCNKNSVDSEGVVFSLWLFHFHKLVFCAFLVFFHARIKIVFVHMLAITKAQLRILWDQISSLCAHYIYVAKKHKLFSMEVTHWRGWEKMTVHNRG